MEAAAASHSQLPDHLLPQILRFLDPTSLVSWEQTSWGATPAPDWIWESLVTARYSWLYPRRPSVFTTSREFYVRLRRASARKEECLGGRRPGGIYVVGGCDLEREGSSSAASLFKDIGLARVVNERGGSYAHPLRMEAMPDMLEPRSALALTRDHSERIIAIGGWSGDHALSSVEQLDPVARQWTRLQPCRKPRCFLASVTDLEGRVHAFGGGTSVWQGAGVFSCTEYMEISGHEVQWREGVQMNAARCGLGACIMEDGTTVVVGGYGGGDNYLRSAESLSPTGDRWVNLQEMHFPRTGLGVCYGPDRCIYAVGGSANGLTSHRSVERLDLRVGAWERIGRMVLARGYCAATFAPSGLLYAVGGQLGGDGGEDEIMCRTVECLDVRRPDRWRVLAESDLYGVSGVDLAACFSLLD